MSVAGGTRRLAVGAPARPAEGSLSLGRIALIAAICAIPVVLYLPFLAEPFFRDEGLYAAVAQVILDLCGNKQREMSMPRISGVLTMLTYLMPWLGRMARPLLERRGANVKARLKKKM